MDRRKETTGHFILHWGVPREIHVRPRLVADFAVIEFGPRGERTTWRYATNGMGAIPQQRKSVTYGTELFTCSASSSAWIIRLMDAIARYPLQQETSLGEYDTMPAGGPLDGQASPYTGILLAPPDPPDAETLGLVGRNDPLLFVHQVVAIHPAELEYAVVNGGKALWQRLLALETPLLMDTARPVAVE
jgi:hypothetical protein